LRHSAHRRRCSSQRGGTAWVGKVAITASPSLDDSASRGRDNLVEQAEMGYNQVEAIGSPARAAILSRPTPQRRELGL
jgi:hypothetical protein